MAPGKNTGAPRHGRETFLKVHCRLCEAYGCPVPYFRNLDPLSELIGALLSHRTRDQDCSQAFKALRDRYPTWSHVQHAPTSDVEETISKCTWPEQKAPRIQQVLDKIEKETGSLSLDFLGSMPSDQARAWLERLPGVGPKTSAAVVSFSRLRGRALPVDSHHHRVAQRLGWIPATMDVGPAHSALEAMLPPEWGAQQVYDHHEVMMFHGRRTCFFRNPACSRCPVSAFCPTGQQRLGEDLTSRAKLI